MAAAAWLLWVFVTGAATVLLVVHASTSGTPVYEFWLESLIGGSVFATVGALILRSRPGNAIGWMFSFGAVGSGFQFLTGQYAVFGLRAGANFPGAEPAAVLSNSLQPLVVMSFLLAMALFPTGRLASARWRPVMYLLVTGFTVIIITSFLAPGPLESLPDVHNPFGLSGAAGPLDALTAVGGAMGVLGGLAALASLAARYRRALGEERRQLKWFAYAAGLGMTLILASSFFLPAGLEDQVGSIIWTVAPSALPVAVGVAILRHGLYDIDRIINRTLVYGALTVVLLGLCYAGIVVLLQSVFAPVTEDQSYAVVGSTLAVAALFRPARARMQGFIDRRFYRARYDATRTLEDFTARLRDEIDLDALSRELIEVVNATMRPAHASLWLRGPAPIFDRSSTGRKAHA